KTSSLGTRLPSSCKNPTPIDSQHLVGTIPFIQDGLINSGRLKRLEYPKPLKGIHVMDIGCGGGLLCEGTKK
ncbi:unnamed protein product, partial [Allacma fusca]